MEKEVTDLFELARDCGFPAKKQQLYELVDWLREEKKIHVEVSSIWDELTNEVESYCFTITSPINIYYTEPLCISGGKNYKEMLLKGTAEALLLLKEYHQQHHLCVTDDEAVIAYLKGYGDKGKMQPKPRYRTNIEKFAYLKGKQGDYIEDGLTEDDILLLVRNRKQDEEVLKLK